MWLTEWTLAADGGRMNIIAVDCGASFLKGALIDPDNKRILKTSFRSSPKPNLGKSVDFNDFHVLILLQKITELLAELSDGESELGLCISNEMHGFVLADENGSPLTDYISWQDERALEAENESSYLDNAKCKTTPDMVLNTGMPLKCGLPSVNVYWLKQNGFFNRHEKCFFYTLGDFIIRSLSGKESFIHPTNAAATGLFDIGRKGWNSDLIHALQIGDIVYPKLCAEKPETLRFIIGGAIYHALPAIGDQQAALLGAGLDGEDQLSVNIGTGAQVSVASRTQLISPGYQTRPYFNGMYLHTVPHIPSGRALNVFFRFVKDCIGGFCGNEISDELIWKMILEKVKSAKDSSLTVDLSFFTNAITANTEGAIGHIEENQLLIGELFKAVFHQMAKNFVSAAARLPARDDVIRRVLFSGGLSQKVDYLREKIIELLPFKAESSFTENETFVGLTEYFRLSQVMSDG